MPAGGIWTLQLTDDTTNPSGGILQNWSVEVCGDPPPAYGIELTKTVGLEPGVCATTDSIVVPPGGFTVHYCYTVRNPGLNPVNLHDLIDSELGTIFTGLSYPLAPAATYSPIQAATVHATVTNTATWTAGDGTATASDSATVTVLLPANVSGTKTVAGTFSPLGTVTYTIVLTNAGPGIQVDNPGDEFIDTLPGEFNATGVSASSGSAFLAGNTVTWNGSLAVGATVTITATASVNYLPGGTVISNQGTIFYDAGGDGTNSATRLTDDPGVAGAADPTDFVVIALEPIPTLHGVGLATLNLLLGMVAVLALRRHS